MKRNGKLLPILLCVAFAVAMLINYAVVTGQRDDVLTEQQNQIYELSNQIAVAQSAYANMQTNVVMTTTGLDLHRTSTDDEIVMSFLDLICSWDSYDEYMTARETIMRRYNIAEDSYFMSVFMPEVVSGTSPDGTQYNYIDTLGLNMQFEEMKSYVTMIVADEYSYFTFVTVSSSWENGGESMGTYVITYTCDAAGELTNIMAVPVG